MAMSLKSSFNHYLMQKYPELNLQQVDLLVSENLLSPFQVKLNSSLIADMKNEIKGYWQLRSWSEKNLSSKYESMGLRKSDNYAACMSYDFHLSSAGKLELIEINTNASFLALGLELYSFLKLENVDSEFTDKKIAEMFLNEINLSHSHFQPQSIERPTIGIFDENPEQQKLFIEFLIYQQMLQKQGVPAKIINQNDIQQLKQFSIIYNRYTDFYLQNEASQKIKELFNSGEIQLSPNPWEYFLLADKQRLIDWNLQSDCTKPASLLPVIDLAKAPRDDVWAQRKQLFFKPKTSFGGKQAYRGASITRKAFDSIFHDDFMAQKISAPSEIEFIYNSEPIKFKYDLRCYAYQDQLQMVIARLYQGQTTNLGTPGGGFAAVIFN